MPEAAKKPWVDFVTLHKNDEFARAYLNAIIMLKNAQRGCHDKSI